MQQPTESDVEMEPWSVCAINLPEHGDNPIHTDEGARAAGFDRALVAGTTVYAYLTHPPAVAWGRSWIDRGGAEVRFRAPVFDDDFVECAIFGTRVEAQVGGATRATFDVWLDAATPAALVGDHLPDTRLVLDDDLARYGSRAGDTLELYADEGICHPVVWPRIGNQVTKQNFVDGPWVHVRSRVAHLGPAPFGAEALVESRLAERFDSRAGERVVLDVRVSIAGVPVAAIEHESIIRLA